MRIEKNLYGFLGFGHIAKILFQAVQKARLIPKSQIVFTRKDPKKKVETEQKHKITGVSVATLVEKSSVIFLCVKPQNLSEVASELSKFDLTSKKIISVLAGTTLCSLQKKLGGEIIRVMPNVPSLIGEGMNVFSSGENVSDEFIHMTKMIFSCMGRIQEIPEKLMDVATGICGSGPGFVYMLIDAIAKLGEEEGIQYEDALQMVSQTFIGAAKMIQKKNLPDKLIQDMSLSGGTTICGFEAMKKHRVQELLKASVKSSIERAKELSKM